jgi:hypothetical protein
VWRRFRELEIDLYDDCDSDIKIIRSFYLEPVYRLIPVFNPFSMSMLLVRCFLFLFTPGYSSD